MPPAPVRESTAPRAMVFPALLPPLGVAVPLVVLLLQAERRRVQTTSSDAALRPNFRSTFPPITAYGTDSRGRSPHSFGGLAKFGTFRVHTRDFFRTSVRRALEVRATAAVLAG